MTATPSKAGGSPGDDAAKNRYALRKKLRAHTPGKPQVWIARDRRLACDVVLKKYVGEELAPLWDAEAKLLSLGLPQLPRLFDAVALGDSTRLLVREYLAGTPLSDLAMSLRPEPATSEKIARVLRYAGRAARLIHALHSAKPQPVSLSECVGASDFILCGSDSQFDLRLLPSISSRHLPSVVPDLRGDVARLGQLAVELLQSCDERFAPGIDTFPHLVAEALRRAIHTNPDERHGSALWLAQALDEATGDASLSDFAKQIAWKESLTPPSVRMESRLVDADDTLAGRWLQTGRFSHDLNLARAAHQLSEMVGVGDDSGPLIALETLECNHYAHQLESVGRVVSSPEMRAGAILSDEVGLGKTVEALLICQELRARGMANSVLVIATPSGVAQWAAECSRRIRRESAGAPEFHVYGGERDLSRSLLIISSAALRRQQSLSRLIETRQDDLVIVDEAHQCCDAGNSGRLSDLGDAVTRLRRKRLLLLTATPMTGSAAQLATLADLIEPGLIDPALADGIGSAGDDASVARLRVLRARMQAVMVRHRRSELAESLPSLEVVVRKIPVDSTSLDCKAQTAADLICGEWRRERVVAFCRSPAIREALADELERRAPKRTVIQFQGGRREQRIQEHRFAEYADAVMIAGDKSAEGMNWQRARCLVHLDMPLTPVVWEQRVGRIVRLGQRAAQLEIAHLIDEREQAAMDLYERSLGLFTLPVGDAANVLDNAPSLSLHGFERAIRASLSRNGLSRQRFDSISEHLRRARAAYEQQKIDNRLLDEFYSATGSSPSARQGTGEQTVAAHQSRQTRLEEFVQAAFDAVGIPRRETQPGSGVWIAHFDGEPSQIAVGRALTGSDENALLYTFHADHWESGSRLQYCTPNSPLVKRLCAWVLACCPITQAHTRGAGATEPYLAARFRARWSGALARESSEWWALNLRTREIKRLSRDPLSSAHLIPGPPASSAARMPPVMLASGLALLCSRFNADADAAGEEQRIAEQFLLDRRFNQVSSANWITPEAREAALIRLRQTELQVETMLLGAALLWMPARSGSSAGATV